MALSSGSTPRLCLPCHVSSALNDFSTACFASQARVSATSSGSCGMEEFTLTQDRGRQRGNDMSSPLETAAGPNEDIGGDARSSQRLVGEATAAALGCRVVRHEHHEIVVAVFVRIAACDGAKQIDTVRSVSADETLDHEAKPGVMLEDRVCHRWARPGAGIALHRHRDAVVAVR